MGKNHGNRMSKLCENRGKSIEFSSDSSQPKAKTNRKPQPQKTPAVRNDTKLLLLIY